MANGHAIHRQQVGETERPRAGHGLLIDRYGRSLGHIPGLARFGTVAGGEPQRRHGRIHTFQQTGGLGGLRACREDFLELDAIAAEVF